MISKLPPTVESIEWVIAAKKVKIAIRVGRGASAFIANLKEILLILSPSRKLMDRFLFKLITSSRIKRKATLHHSPTPGLINYHWLGTNSARLKFNAHPLVRLPILCWLAGSQTSIKWLVQEHLLKIHGGHWRKVVKKVEVPWRSQKLSLKDLWVFIVWQKNNLLLKRKIVWASILKLCKNTKILKGQKELSLQVLLVSANLHQRNHSSAIKYLSNASSIKVQNKIQSKSRRSVLSRICLRSIKLKADPWCLKSCLKERRKITQHQRDLGPSLGGILLLTMRPQKGNRESATKCTFDITIHNLIF